MYTKHIRCKMLVVIQCFLTMGVSNAKEYPNKQLKRSTSMSNTEKKLDALIDALGFDVEEVVTTVHPPFSIMKALFTDRYNQQGPIDTVDYKITKRENKIFMTFEEYKRHVIDNPPGNFFRGDNE